MNTSTREAHNAFQRQYFDRVERLRLAVVDTPYVRRHVDQLVETGGLTPGARLLEIGAGLGKFTFPLLERGFDVTVNDLSPVLLERLALAAPRPVRTVACDVVDIEQHVERPFHAIIGFFVLHHLVDFDRIFRVLSCVLAPGGRVAFCEPVAWNPLYYIQIALTPGMRFSGERSLTSMTPGIILPALSRAGFVHPRSHRYGYFPPFLKNTRAGDAAERWLDRRTWIPFPHAFQVFTAQLL
jgi:2-polyprenyl-3-methyl-5-hydroxy-6-metoxy-1,4-benzoquinol methylase